MRSDAASATTLRRMRRVNVTVQHDLFPFAHERHEVERWLREGLQSYDDVSISWMDNPWITDVGDLDGLVRLSVEFAIDGDFRYGGDAASIGQGLV